MKKIIIACFAVSMVILSVVLIGLNGKEPAHYSVSAKGIGFETLDEMEDYSDIIVRVERTDEETPVVKYEQDEVYSGYTFSQVIIKEIYASKDNMLEEGQKIRILENEFYDEKDNIVYHVGGYNMMEEGKEYLLFLKKHTDTDGEVYYVASGVNFGTVSIQSDNRTMVYSTRDGQTVGSFDAMEPIWEAALEKYITE